MSDIKQAGIKGYVIMGAFIGLLLFIFLVVYIYKSNGDGVPQDPDHYGAIVGSARALMSA